MTTSYSSERPAILLIAGFGDNASMFAGLLRTELAARFDLRPLDLPGFGRPALEKHTTLSALADFVADKAVEFDAKVIVAHSVASIIASLAARHPDCPLKIIVSLEGNLTAQDAYFSGMAADFATPAAFREAFLARLGDIAETTPTIARYRREVARADPRALWRLGCDARRFSNTHHPGETLASAASAVYLYNPDNCPAQTLAWLSQSDVPRLVLANATHWKSVDQPVRLAQKLGQALEMVGWS